MNIKDGGINKKIAGRLFGRPPPSPSSSKTALKLFIRCSHCRSSLRYVVDLYLMSDTKVRLTVKPHFIDFKVFVTKIKYSMTKMPPWKGWLFRSVRFLTITRPRLPELRRVRQCLLFQVLSKRTRWYLPAVPGS